MAGLGSSHVSGSMNLLRVLICKAVSMEFLPKLEPLFDVLSDFLLGTASGSLMPDSTKTTAFELFGEITKKLNKYSELVPKLERLHENPTWRTEKASDWNISSDIPEENGKNYVGLINMGATCYVNSVIQQLFMLPQFRNAILETEVKPRPGDVLTELQQVFGMLYQRQLSNYKAKGLYDAMGVDVNVQKDASEFLINLFDKISECLKATKHSHIIKDFFEIKTATKITCKKCATANEIPATTLLLGLEVKGKKKMSEGLEAFIKPEILHGDNAYFCEKCARKVDAEKQETIKGLPNILLVQLKRFELTYGDSDNKKVNSYFEFPMDLDLEEYIALKKDPAFSELCKAYFCYKLKGVVIHTGTLNAGHYYSLIKDSEKDKWYQFNDTLVQEFDLSDFKEEAFGNYAEKSIEKSYNAYILVYERTVLLPKEMQALFESGSLSTEAIKEFNAAKGAREPQSSPKVKGELKGKLMEERKEFMDRQLVFSPAYARFVTEIIRCEQIEDKLMEFGVKFLLTVLVRSTMKDVLFEFTALLEKHCAKNKAIATEIVKTFSIPGILHEFLLDCPKMEARKCVCAILKASITSVYELEEKTLDQYFDKPTDEPPYLIYLMDGFIQQVDKINRNFCGQYFDILLQLAKLKTSTYLRNSALAGIALELLDFSVGNSWKKYALEALPHLSWKGSTFLAPSKDCFMVPEKTLFEKAFSAQALYMVALITELIKSYANPNPPVPSIDFEEVLGLIKEPAAKILYKIGAASAMGQDAVAELLGILAKIKEEQYAIQITSIAFSRMSLCDTLELPAVLKTIELLLKTQNDTLFNEIFSRLIKEIAGEFKKNYNMEYFTITCYIDFVLSLCKTHKNCFMNFSAESKHEQAKLLLDAMAKWLEWNNYPKEAVKLFRGCYKSLPKESSSIIPVSKQANLERAELIAKIRGKEHKEWICIEKDTINTWKEGLKIGHKVDLYMQAPIKNNKNRLQAKKWVKGEVINICDAAVKVKLDEEEEVWVEFDLERLAPESTRVNNARTQEQDLLIKLYPVLKKQCQSHNCYYQCIITIIKEI
eukprot:TRINITY_DN1069_c0_g1_i1.p1 TRINITY_DN1069_c0_g1~~TRINITY_DN1069_c0_g1_i1.p1  ORF type:complete len:1056 (-),score=148.20 TRINITY_DN1069_c0_g1_i1:16535-19702(-)